MNIVGNLNFISQKLGCRGELEMSEPSPLTWLQQKVSLLQQHSQTVELRGQLSTPRAVNILISVSAFLPSSRRVPLLQGYPATPVTNPAIIQLSLKANASAASSLSSLSLHPLKSKNIRIKTNRFLKLFQELCSLVLLVPLHVALHCG